MPTLYVIRHGEPESRGALLGQSDPQLSEKGLRQAASLAGSIPVCTIYSSPLLRARQTAQILSKHPVILSELAEISYGEWDGLIWREIELKWPDIAREKLANWEHVIPPGGEHWSGFRRRVSSALNLVLAGPLPAAIVAHEAVNAAIAGELTNAAIQSYQQKHCEVRAYEIPFSQ